MEIEKKILIVDDKPENLVALEKLLDFFNVTIIKAFSGNDALTKTLEHDFALALIDVQMPDMDGYETVKLMRNVDKTRLLPVIFLSAIYSENHYAIQGIEAGAVDFIAKPIQPRIMMGKVKIFLDLYEQKKILELEIEQRIAIEKNLRETEKELLKAKNRAEVSDLSKSRFLANMSHEIRTPLNTIVGFSAILANEELSIEKKEKFITYINNSSESLTSIINDILDISKIEAGELKIVPAPLNISDFFNELNTTFQYELEKRGRNTIELKFTISNLPENFLIETDEKRLRQIVVNLINNAIKFTLKGTIEITIVRDGDKKIRIIVTDTGIGIPENKLSEIFEPFLQVESKQTNNTTGTGLGLSIVNKLAVLLGGSIQVESKENIGSTFYLTLPVKEINVKTNNIIMGVAEQGAAYKWTGRKILVAEDEPLNYMLIEEILSDTNVSLTWADDGQKAYNEFLQNSDYDLILMDIKMPNMNGHEACTEIRKINTQIPIIAQTAYAMAGDRELCLQKGFNAYLTKPFNKSELCKVINSFFDKK
jgi:signal transduction histidine kinase